MNPNPTRLPTRREFLQQMAGGIVVLVSLSSIASAEVALEGIARVGPVRPELPTDFNAFVRIGEDGRVTGFTGKIEMGQG